jgi:aryl-alcohol dehydrogenase
METIAAVVRAPGDAFSVESVAVEAPRAGEVRVRIAGVGLCHTDLVFRDQVAAFPRPAVLGHEGSGIVEAVGPGVTGLAVGDPVVLGFSSCGACPRCDEGLPSYCRSFVPLNYAGVRPEDGTSAYAAGGAPVASHFFGQSSFAGLAVVRARNVVKVANAAAPLELLGPLGCGFQTGAGAVMRTFDCGAGSTIAIAGGGPVGLAAVMAAAIRGCSAIVLVEPIAARRDLARELGATHAIDPVDAPDLAAAIRDAVPDGVDFAFDTTGIVPVIEALLAALGSHGALGLVGVPKSPDAAFPVNVTALMTPGLRIFGIIEGDSDPAVFIPELLAHHAAGRFPFDRLIETFPLARINEAVEAQARGAVVKAVLVP